MGLFGAGKGGCVVSASLGCVRIRYRSSEKKPTVRTPTESVTKNSTKSLAMIDEGESGEMFID